MTPFFVHGTAILLGSTGLILIGPPGAGKSSMALALMATARRVDRPSFLVSDDQVLIDCVDGKVVARSVGQMAGRIELRGSGIGTVASVDQAFLHFALAPVVVDSENRIPEDGLRHDLGHGLSLPLIRIDRRTIDPFAVLEALLPDFPG